jgi:hypothetical protein
MEMKSKKIFAGQYAFETKYLEGDNEKYLHSVAPLIGYIVYEFNSLEERLTALIHQMISDRSDDKGIIITYKMSYSQKVDLFNRYSTWAQNICNKAISNHQLFVQTLTECGRLRNMVVHAEWETVDRDGFALVKIKVEKNGIQQEYVQFDLDSLAKINGLITDAYNKFDEYEDEYFEL